MSAWAVVAILWIAYDVAMLWYACALFGTWLDDRRQRRRGEEPDRGYWP